ncbi:hypothetical protein EDB89DRAFT_1959436, partial [Lactarius sanguifluus]
MAEVLDILGTATKEMKQSRANKFIMRVAGITKLEDGLKKLDRMTNEEARMASAEALKVAHNIVKEVKVIEEKVQTVIDNGKETATEAKKTMQQTAPVLTDVTRSQGSNYESSSENGNLFLIRPQITKSRANINTKEQRSGSSKATSLRNGRWLVPCLWIHGKPGSGKSIL